LTINRTVDGQVFDGRRRQIWDNFLHYCRVHSTIESTPAVKAEVALEKWTVERLLEEATKVQS
jgi:hypothetical protein